MPCKVKGLAVEGVVSKPVLLIKIEALLAVVTGLPMVKAAPVRLKLVVPVAERSMAPLNVLVPVPATCVKLFALTVLLAVTFPALLIVISPKWIGVVPTAPVKEIFPVAAVKVKFSVTFVVPRSWLPKEIFPDPPLFERATLVDRVTSFAKLIERPPVVVMPAPREVVPPPV